MALIDASQLNGIFTPSAPISRDTEERFILEVDGSTILIVGGELKAGVMESANIAAGAILDVHVGFTSFDVPHSSAHVSSLNVGDALEEVAVGYQACLPLSGGTMTGPIDMDSSQIVGLGAPTAPDHAVNYGTMLDAIAQGIFLLPPVGYASPLAAKSCLQATWIRANASIYFNGNPSPGDTLYIHGVTLTFDTVAAPNKILIGGTPAATVGNAVSEIQANITPTLDGIQLNLQFHPVQGNGDGTVLHLVCLNEDPPNTPEDGNTKLLSVVSSVLEVVDFHGGLGAVLDGALVEDLLTQTLYTYDRMAPLAPWVPISGGGGGPVDAINVNYTGPAIPYIGPTPNNLQALLISLNTNLGSGLPPAPHAPTHETGGPDEIDVSGLLGKLADLQDAGWLQGIPVSAALPSPGDVLTYDGAGWTPLSSGTTTETFVAGQALSAFEAVYVSGTNTANKAIASALGTAEVVGITLTAIGIGLLGPVITDQGRKATAQFETGLTLTDGEDVYLSKAVAGALTNVPPIAPSIVRRVGILNDSSAYVGTTIANSRAIIVLQSDPAVSVPADGAGQRFLTLDENRNWVAVTDEEFRSAIYDVLYLVGPGGVAVRDVVYVSGSDQVDKADALFENKMPAIGFVSALVPPNKCLVRTGSLLPGFVGLTPNATYWVDPTTPGGITSTPPDLTARVIQEVAYGVKADTIMVEIDRDYTVNPA